MYGSIGTYMYNGLYGFVLIVHGFIQIENEGHSANGMDSGCEGTDSEQEWCASILPVYASGVRSLPHNTTRAIRQIRSFGLGVCAGVPNSVELAQLWKLQIFVFSCTPAPFFTLRNRVRWVPQVVHHFLSRRHLEPNWDHPLNISSVKWVSSVSCQPRGLDQWSKYRVTCPWWPRFSAHGDSMADHPDALTGLCVKVLGLAGARLGYFGFSLHNPLRGTPQWLQHHCQWFAAWIYRPGALSLVLTNSGHDPTRSPGAARDPPQHCSQLLGVCRLRQLLHSSFYINNVELLNNTTNALQLLRWSN